MSFLPIRRGKRWICLTTLHGYTHGHEWNAAVVEYRTIGVPVRPFHYRSRGSGTPYPAAVPKTRPGPAPADRRCRRRTAAEPPRARASGCRRPPAGVRRCGPGDGRNGVRPNTPDPQRTRPPVSTAEFRGDDGADVAHLRCARVGPFFPPRDRQFLGTGYCWDTPATTVRARKRRFRSRFADSGRGYGPIVGPLRCVTNLARARSLTADHAAQRAALRS